MPSPLPIPRRTYGSGQIRWLESRRCFLAQLVIPGGRRISKTFAPADYKTARQALQAAEAWLAEQNLLKQKGTLLEPTRVTLGEWIEEYLRNPTWKEKTRADYAAYLRRFVSRHLGHLRLQELTPARVQQWAATVPATPYQRAKALHYLKLCLNRAVDLELIHRNPARKVRVEKPHPRPQPAWDAHEARAALEYLRTHDPFMYRYVYLALTTGLRREELLGLKWQYVDLEAGLLRIEEVCTYVNSRPSFGRPKTPGSRRTVYLDPGTVAILQEQREYCETLRALRKDWVEMGLVFPSRRGTPLSETNLSELMRHLARTLGITHIPPKNLRHTHVTLLDSTGKVPLHVAAQRTGHSPAVREQHYQARLERQQREAALGLAELLGEANANNLQTATKS